jgi:hypothetical protein
MAGQASIPGQSKIAGVSAAAFVTGAVGGAVGNQLGSWGTWYWWVAFLAMTVLGAGLSFWLVQRTASSAAVAEISTGTTHTGDNHVGAVMTESGTAIGVNYGTTHNRTQKK